MVPNRPSRTCGWGRIGWNSGPKRLVKNLWLGTYGVDVWGGTAVPNRPSRTCGWGRIGWNSGPKRLVKNLWLGTYGVEQWSQTARQEPVVGDVWGGTVVPNRPSRTCGWGRMGWNSGPKQAVKNLWLGTYGVEQWSQTGRQEPVVGDVWGGTVVPNRPSRTCGWGRMGWNSGSPKQAVKNLWLGKLGGTVVPNRPSRTCGWGRMGWTYGVEQQSQTGRQEPVVGDAWGGTVVPNRPSRTCCWARMGWNSSPKRVVKNLWLGTYGVEQRSQTKQARQEPVVGHVWGGTPVPNSNRPSRTCGWGRMGWNSGPKQAVKNLLLGTYGVEQQSQTGH